MLYCCVSLPRRRLLTALFFPVADTLFGISNQLHVDGLGLRQDVLLHRVRSERVAHVRPVRQRHVQVPEAQAVRPEGREAQDRKLEGAQRKSILQVQGWWAVL